MDAIQQEQGLVQATERRIEDTLKEKEKKEYNSFRGSICCCGAGMIGLIIYLLIISGINFLFLIIALSSLIKRNAAYLILYTYYCPSNSILDDYLGGVESSLLNGLGTKSSFISFWCGIGSFEDGVLISYLIFIILFIGFEIISLLIHKHIIKLSIEEEGLLYYILIGSNSIFLVIFYIYIPLLFYLYIYIMIILTTAPVSENFTSNSQSGTQKEKDLNEIIWEKSNGVPIVNSIFVFLIFIFDAILLKVKKSIILYLSMRYDNNNVNLNNEKTKKKTVRINNNNVEFEIQANQVTYLERVGQNDKIYRFKKIKINGLTNDFIYLFLNNKAIDDQLSITDWEFPIFNELYLKIAKIAHLIYGLLFVSIPLFKLHLYNEYTYIYTKNMYSNLIEGIKVNTVKPKFYSVYSSYGIYEFRTSDSRFALYVIALFFILLSMGKRIIYGGYTRPITILICFIASAIFVLVNIIYIILSFLIMLFSVFSIVCFYDIFKGNNNLDGAMQGKFFTQLILNIIIFSICIRILIDSIQLTIMLNKLKKEYTHLNDGTEQEEQEKIKGFQYQGLDNQLHILNEITIKGHPQYIYYNLYGDINNVQAQPNISKNKEKENIDNSQKNSVNIPMNSSTTRIRQNQNDKNSLNSTNVGGFDLINARNENQNLKNENKKLNEELKQLKNSLSNIQNSNDN